MRSSGQESMPSPPAAAGWLQARAQRRSSSLKSTEVGRAGHSGKLWGSAELCRRSPFPLTSPFSTHFPLSAYLLISQGDRAAVRRYEGPAHGSSYRSMLPPAPTKSKTNHRNAFHTFPKTRERTQKILAFVPSPLNPSLGPQVWSRLPASPGFWKIQKCLRPRQLLGWWLTLKPQIIKW